MTTVSEHDEQKLLVSWCSQVAAIYPGADRIFAIPNAGKRSPRAGKWMKEEGLKEGVPDLFIPVRRGDKAGLFIEMKHGSGKPTKVQAEWLRFLSRDYETAVCWSCGEAIEVIKRYYREGRSND